MREIPLTKGMVAKVDDQDYVRLSSRKWRALNPPGKRSWYASRQVWEGGKNRAVLMHREIMGAPQGSEVDHVDGDGLNNQRANLRVCSRSENARNQRPRTDGISRYKGVSFNRRAGKWTAQICVNKEKRYLGLYSSEADAAKAYNEAATEVFGGFALLNSL